MRRICLRPDGSMVGRVVIKEVFLVAADEVLGFEIKRRPGWCRPIYPPRLSQGHYCVAHAGESDAELRKTDSRKIGRAWCGARVCQDVQTAVVSAQFKQENTKITAHS